MGKQYNCLPIQKQFFNDHRISLNIPQHESSQLTITIGAFDQKGEHNVYSRDTKIKTPTNSRYKNYFSICIHRHIDLNHRIIHQEVMSSDYLPIKQEPNWDQFKHCSQPLVQPFLVIFDPQFTLKLLFESELDSALFQTQSYISPNWSPFEDYLYNSQGIMLFYASFVLIVQAKLGQASAGDNDQLS